MLIDLPDFRITFSVGVCAVVVRMCASCVAWPTRLDRTGVLPPTARAFFAFPFPSCFIILCLSVGTSLRIRKDTTITHRSRIRKRAHWVTARFAWTRSSVRRKIRLENRDDAAQGTAHRIVWRPVRIYSYVSPSSSVIITHSFIFFFTHVTVAYRVS